MTTKTLTDGLNGVSANDIQHGGTHYKDMTIQPWAVMEAVLTHEEFVGFLKGNIIKYIMRYKDKNGIEDLYKAQWYIKELIKRNK